MTAALLAGIWQGAPIVATAWVTTLFVPRRHAATRYAIWYAALIAVAILPLLTLWHPLQVAANLALPVTRTAAATEFVTAKAAGAGGHWLALAWLAGVGFGFIRLTLSYVRIHRILRAATLAPQLGANVWLSDRLTLPIAAGILAPRIVVPTGLAATLDRRDLDAIVQHERAHVRRGDIAGNLVQRILETILFFNPWVYVAGLRLGCEREAACDDWVVRATNQPDRYAACLAHLAQSVRHARTPLLTPSAIGSRHAVVARIARLLDGKVVQVKTNYTVLAATVLSFALIAVLLQTSGVRASDGIVALNATAGTNCYANAKPLSASAPDIPKADAKLDVSADALVTIAPDGRPVSAKIAKSSGNAAIDRATVAAAMSSTYSPQRSACKAVTGLYLFRVDVGTP